MKRLFQVLTALVLVLALASCTVGRKNSAKSLKIKSYEKASNTYVVEYIGSELDFGSLYLTIKDEALVNVVCEFKAAYKLGEYQVKVGEYSSNMNETTESTKLTLAFENPFKFVKEKAEDGTETLNKQTISIYVEFVDARKGNEDAPENLISSSSVKLSITSNDILTFIRNKAPKTSE
ncbi:MAG: hypothetical protein K6F59_03145 [Gammaproteobacteria bacterium]|nr:hypothetical protein [Gammaproteobacteria bacterium]